MARRETDGSGPWMAFLVCALVLVLAVIGYLVSQGDFFGPSTGRLVQAPRLLSAPSPQPLPLPRPTPVGEAVGRG